MGSVRIKACKKSPNCVSSMAQGRHYIPPLVMRTTTAGVHKRVLQWLQQQKRARIECNETDYLHITFRSAMFGFVDDLEVHIDEKSGLVHLRSAARVGYWDIGVNRRRVRNLCRYLER